MTKKKFISCFALLLAVAAVAVPWNSPDAADAHCNGDCAGGTQIPCSCEGSACTCSGWYGGCSCACEGWPFPVERPCPGGDT